MRAIFIKASTGDIIEGETTATLDELCELTGGRYIEGVRIDAFHTLYLNDDGALTGETFGFEWDGNRYFGDGVILGTDEWGENVDCTIEPWEVMMRLGRRFT